jgi:DNA-directed RNA polymerase alpha subunit
MSESKRFTAKEAKSIGKKLGIDWKEYDVEQFRMGLDVELEHGTVSPKTNVTNDDPILTGKIALAHLNEFPDYYTRLEVLEEEATAALNERKKAGKKAKRI